MMVLAEGRRRLLSLSCIGVILCYVGSVVLLCHLAIALIIGKLDAVLRIQDEKREEKQMRMRDGSRSKIIAEDKDRRRGG